MIRYSFAPCDLRRASFGLMSLQLGFEDLVFIICLVGHKGYKIRQNTVDYQNNTDQNNAHLGILAIIDEFGVRLWRKVREQQLPIYLISVLESL